jgi:type I restriction enzyme R subunit
LRITGDEKEGKKELDNFINPEERYPVIACTSKLMTTGVDAQTCKLIVLDSNINSMTEFKQIIGRGTRVNEEYEKFYFTIMDFRNVTKLFSDPTFDGDPVIIKELGEEDSMPDDNQTGEDLPNESETENSPPTENNISITSGGVIEESKAKEKVYVNGVDVSILNERVQQMDENGKLVTQSLKEYAKKGLLRQYKTLEDFKEEWNKVEKKEVLIHNLKTHGLDLDELKEKANKDLDIFDLLIHIAWDEPPLTRRERVERVKKRNYFAKYGDKARKILETLLDKYGRDGIENIENLQILKVEPFVHLGTPIEILREFGGKDKYKSAIKELEKEIYTVAA